MGMAKSAFANAVDVIQTACAPVLKPAGFRKRGRTHNRSTEDGLVQVIAFQMGASDPPGATHIPGLSSDLHGLFTVNLGVYVPEVAEWTGTPAKAFVSESDCTIRSRLVRAADTEADDLWWPADATGPVPDEIRRRLERDGLALLDRYATRDAILADIDEDAVSHPHMLAPPRMVGGIILAERGDRAGARHLFERQKDAALSGGRIGHADYIAGLIARLDR